MIKHIGKHGDRKVAIIFREIPGDEHMCLVVYPETLPSIFEDAVMKVLESQAGQQENILANALHRNLLPDGRIILEALHREGMLKKIPTDTVVVTPTATSNLRLSELNKLVREMESGEEAAKRMAELDTQRGIVAPEVKRKAQKEFEDKQTNKKPTATPLKASSTEALSDRELAANMLLQAQQMEAEAKSLLSESKRIKKQAARLNPNVKVSDAVSTTTETNKTEKKTKPRKAVANAVQS